MRHVANWFMAGAVLFGSSTGFAQGKPSSSTLTPVAKTVTMTQLQNMAALDGQLVQINNVVVRHSDTAQVFTFGEAKGAEIHVVVPSPAIDAAHVGDAVELTGLVRRFEPRAFEKDYQWFRQADYPDVHGGDWVIVATSVRTAEGSQLVPGNTISNMPPNAPKAVPPKR
jgi:hypothetical protein